MRRWRGIDNRTIARANHAIGIKSVHTGGEIILQLTMIKEVLHEVLQNKVTLGFDLENEIQRQFTIIYINGNIDAVEAEQRAKSKNLKVLFS